LLKRSSIVLLAILLILSLVVGCTQKQTAPPTGNDEEKREPVFLSFATSAMGGTFYVAGTGIAALINPKVKDLEITAEVTRGATENGRLFGTGQSDMGFLYGSSAWELVRGVGDYQGEKYEDLKGVLEFHEGAINIVTLRRTGLTKLDDLVGKKVSVGSKGSGTTSVTLQFLESIGFMDKLNIQYLNFNDSASALRDGHIDAFFIGGYPTAVGVLQELDASHDLIFMAVEEDRIQTFLKEHPYHIRFTYDAGMFKNIKQPFDTIGFSVGIFTRGDVPDWVVYEMVKHMFSDEGKQYLINVQSTFNFMTNGIEYFKQIGMEIHPGAVKFYKEKGWM
jgi:TRAP transporter TAXI family solute receptor